MSGMDPWTFYPRASQVFGQIGPRLSNRALIVGAPQQIVSKTPYKAVEEISKSMGAPFNRTGHSANSLRDAAYFKTSGPQPYFLPDLKPSANFSIPTDIRDTKPIHLGDNLQEDTKDLSGIDLLNAMMRYIKRVDVFKLDAKDFQAVLDTGDRLRLSPDPQQAKLKADYDENLSDDDFFKLELWLLSTPAADPNIKRGYVKIEPGGAQVPVTQLLQTPTWTLHTISRIANTGAIVSSVKQALDSTRVVQDEEKKDLGIEVTGFAQPPNRATGRDGNVSIAPDPTIARPGRSDPTRTVLTLLAQQNEMVTDLKSPSLSREQLQRALLKDMASESDAEFVARVNANPPNSPRERAAVVKRLTEIRLKAQGQAQGRSVDDLLKKEAVVAQDVEMQTKRAPLMGKPVFTATDRGIIQRGWPHNTGDYQNINEAMEYLWKNCTESLRILIRRKKTMGYTDQNIFSQMKKVYDDTATPRASESGLTVKQRTE